MTETRKPLALSREFGEQLMRISGGHGSWAAINRVPATGAHWLVVAHDADGGGGWTAAALDEPVMATVLDDDLAIAGRAASAIPTVILSLDGSTRQAKPRPDGLWLMLIDRGGDATNLVVQELDRDGHTKNETLIDLATLRTPSLHSRRSRLRLWLARGLGRPPRGTTSYGRA